ncbi:ATP-binding protein [Actinomadura parmotrematis]|uniref:ATP-binding protein n=1 Tax=Actinomadura parmotrematis TaxID=2864039 RepID=A0ABS7FSQ9_9ACTN|nr:ATP-binding protein [Actinomadura parmotrematis]MBW8483235.1 ATP-binding protein [Actinomadura parmotrematis]
MSDELRVLAALTLPGMNRSVALTRRFLRDTLVPAHVAARAGVLDDMVLVVDELAGNAVRHTASGRGGTFTVTLLRGPGVLRVEVVDDGAGGARPSVQTGACGESGRGLCIVDALAVRWGHRPHGRGTVVWAEFAGPQARANRCPVGP